MWLGVERGGRMVKKHGWGSKHVARGWKMCKLIKKTHTKKKKNIPRAQMTPDMSFGPMGVETGQNGQLGGRNMWLGMERHGWMVKKHGWGSKHVAGWPKCMAGGWNT